MLFYRDASEMYESVVINPTSDKTFKLRVDFRFKDIVVPAGEYSNGANIPRWFWSFIPPNRIDLLPAIIVHDYLTRIEKYKIADDYFNEILKFLEIGKVTVALLTKTVRLYHFVKYGTKWW